MVICEECGGSDFDIHDGLYFCTSCHTQSQNWVEEGVWDDYAPSFTSLGSSSSINRRRIKERKGKKSNDDDLGNDWVTYEAFDLILKKQVDVLMSLGASAKFKMIVCEVWLRYLLKLGLLSRRNVKFVPKIQICPRKRDYDIMLQKRKVVSTTSLYDSQKRYRERRLQMSGFLALKRKKFDTTDEGAEGEDQTSQLTEFGYLSNPSNSINQLAEANEPVPYPCYQISRRHYVKRKIKGERNHVSYIKLGHTVCILYVAVLLSKEQILLGDLLRWIFENQLPLYDAAVKVLPDSFKFQTYDALIFRLTGRLTRQSLIARCALLAKYVGIEDLPEKSIEAIAARFILELDLPVSLIAIVSRLVHSEPKLKRRSFLPDYEIRALAYIVASLKLLFGLNGTSEILLSKMAKRLNEENGGSNYFVLHDWVQKLYVLNEARKQYIPHALWANKMPCKMDAKKLGAYLVDKVLAWRGRYVMRRVKHYETKVKDVVAVLSRPFKALQGVAADVDQPTPTEPSACFLPSNLSAFEQMYGKSSLNASTRKRLDRSFSSASIDFIIDDTDEKLISARYELLRLQPYDVDAAWLTPWTRYTFETGDSSVACGSYHLSLILESFCDIFKVVPSKLLHHIIVIELIIFGKQPKEPRAKKKRTLSRRTSCS